MASEIRVNKINSRTGVGTITLSPTGVDFTGITTVATLNLQDNNKILIGTGDDLEIYHDGSHSYIDDSGTGDLRIRSNNVRFDKYTGETIAQFIGDGRVELYYDNTKRFETTTTGVKTLGDLSIRNSSNTQHILYDESESALEFIDNIKATFGAGNDLQIYHDSSNSRIKNTTGSLWLQSDTGIRFTDADVNESMAAFYDNGAVELYYDGSKKFETTSSGVTVTGGLQSQRLVVTDDGATSPLVSIRSDDSSPWALTIGNDTYSTSDHGISIYQDNSGIGYIRMRGDGVYEGLNFQTNDGTTTNTAITIDSNRAVSLRYQNSQKLITKSDGVVVTGGIYLDGSGGTGSANKLADYEEGTWTPVIKSGTNTISYTGGNQVFRYVKIGKKVTVFFTLDGAVTSGTTGQACTISGLPYASINVTGYRTMGTIVMTYGSGFRLSEYPVFPHISNNSTTLDFYNKASASANYSNTNVDQVGSNSYVFWQITYRTNS